MFCEYVFCFCFFKCALFRVDIPAAGRMLLISYAPVCVCMLVCVYLCVLLSTASPVVASMLSECLLIASACHIL